ncbi:MAG: hypothetical protein JNK48_16560 [Bryobacterales bacterium]|nr:hypothetical protein [Bryobacterales bacterium]
MKQRLTALALLLALGAAAQTARDQRFREDIDFFAETLKTRHPALFRQITAEEFAQAVAELKTKVPDSSDAQIFFGLNRIAARVGDAHTYVLATAGTGVRSMPLRVRAFEEGWYVISAGGSALPALGKRVARIGAFSAEEAFERVRTLIPAENRWWALQQAPALLVSPQALQSAGVSEAADSVEYEFEDGLRLTLREEAAELFDFPRKARPNPPLYRRNAGLYYWFDYVAESRLIYLKYDRCQRDPTLPMERLAREMVEVWGREPVERFVFDLRNNSGGDAGVIRPLLEALAAFLATSGKAPPRGFVFSGRQTFSSGMRNVVDLKATGLVSILGEPTGGSPNGPSETVGFTLPNSRWQGQVSTRVYTAPGYTDTVPPDMAVTFSFADWAAERDPYLERALQ